MSSGNEKVNEYRDPSKVARALEERWWQEDFSWEGLARRHLRIDSKATLQDFWRAAFPDEELIEFAGRRWLRFHLPAHDLDGLPSPKASWTQQEFTKFNRDLTALTEKEPAPAVARLMQSEGISTSQFAGVVFPKLFEVRGERGLRSSFAWAVFCESARFINWETHGPIDFACARFMRATSFERMRLMHGVCLERALFFEVAEFRNVAFQGDLVFDCTFAKAATFAHCTVGRPEARATFANIHFDDDVTFAHSKFHADSDFVGVRFGGRAKFDGAVFESRLRIDNCEFRDKASFTNTDFKGALVISGTIFADDASFTDAEFEGEVTLAGEAVGVPVTFLGRADFSSPSGRAFHRDVMISARFVDAADFRGRIFKYHASFAGSEFRWLALFHGATLPRDVSFAATKFGLPSFRQAKLVAASANLPRSQVDARSPNWAKSLKMRAVRRRQLDILAERFESAFRVLREHVTSRANPEEEAMFYALELDARLLRISVPAFERWLAWLFKVTSSYGRNPTPLFVGWVGAVALWLAAMPIIVLQSVTSQHLPDYQQVAAFALAQFVPLPSVWRPESFGGNGAKWLGELYNSAGLLVGIMGTLSAVLTVSAIALLLIILRRRFALK